MLLSRSAQSGRRFEFCQVLTRLARCPKAAVATWTQSPFVSHGVWEGLADRWAPLHPGTSSSFAELPTEAGAIESANLSATVPFRENRGLAARGSGALFRVGRWVDYVKTCWFVLLLRIGSRAAGKIVNHVVGGGHALIEKAVSRPRPCRPMSS